MIAVFAWLVRRIWCSIRGHHLVADRIYYPPAKSVTSGYRCTRCSKTQLLLKRWQSADRRGSE